MGRHHRVLALAAGLILAVAACGGGGDDADDEPAAAAVERDPCAARVPLVIDLHGYSETAELHESRVGFQAEADEHGALVLTPQAAGDPPAWDLERDVALVAALIDDAVTDECVDADRVFVTGHSMGAMLTSQVACELADRVAAVAPVSGVREVAGCAPARPVPALIVHGTADDVVPFGGGLSQAVAGLLGLTTEGPPVEQLAAAWAARNGCDGTSPAWDCPADADVELVALDGWGHDWPRQENDRIWAFFERHGLRSSPAPAGA